LSVECIKNKLNFIITLSFLKGRLNELHMAFLS